MFSEHSLRRRALQRKRCGSRGAPHCRAQLVCGPTRPWQLLDGAIEALHGAEGHFVDARSICSAVRSEELKLCRQRWGDFEQV